MKRLAFIFASSLCGVVLATGAFAQAAKSASATTAKKDAAPTAAAPAPVSEELMRARMKPPVKGVATVDFVQGPTKPVKDELITVIKIKNTSPSPIVGFRIDQYFYKGQEEVSAGTGRLRNPLAAGEVADVTINAPLKVGITNSQMRFSHANGAVKPTAVKKIGDAADAKAATTAKKK